MTDVCLGGLNLSESYVMWIRIESLRILINLISLVCSIRLDCVKDDSLAFVEECFYVNKQYSEVELMKPPVSSGLSHFQDTLLILTISENYHDLTFCTHTASQTRNPLWLQIQMVNLAPYPGILFFCLPSTVKCLAGFYLSAVCALKYW